jgi:hypothetical protein
MILIVTNDRLSRPRRTRIGRRAKSPSTLDIQGNDWQQILGAKWDQFGDKLNGVYKPSASRIDLQSTIENFDQHHRNHRGPT